MTDWKELLSTILYAVLAAAAPVLTKFAVDFIKAKYVQLTESMESEAMRQGLSAALDAVLTAVTVTNQTYVDALKNKNMFDKEAQKTAFTMAWDTAQGLLTDAAKDSLVALYGGIDDWLAAKIEQTTKELKV